MAASKEPLKTKLNRRRIPLLVDDAAQMEVIRTWEKEDHEKLLLLCAELNIAEGPNRFYDLSLALARKYHRAFQESAPLGKWTDIAGAYLVVEVERLTQADDKPGHGELWAAYQLIKRPEWRAFLGGSEDPGEALRRQYQKFKKHPLASVARDAFKHHEMESDLAGWELSLKDVLRNPHPDRVG
jgi:hypothetical protein